MSRYYAVTIVTKDRRINEGTLEMFMWQQGFGESVESSHFTPTFETWTNGKGNLCGGESEEDAHARISAALKEEYPGLLVRTVWTYLEDLPTTEYGDDLYDETWRQ